MFSFGQKLLHNILVNLPTIVPEIFATLDPSNVAKPPSSNMVNHLAWTNKIETMPTQSKERSPTFF